MRDRAHGGLNGYRSRRILHGGSAATNGFVSDVEWRQTVECLLDEQCCPEHPCRIQGRLVLLLCGRCWVRWLTLLHLLSFFQLLE